MRDFGRNGSFMVIRQLAQDVNAFNTFVAKKAKEHQSHPAIPRLLPPALREEWIGAKMVGRWKDGSSLVRFPHGPATSQGHDKDSFQPDNEFLYGAEDPLGERCPMGAHIRRSNPRDSQRPGSTEELAIVNRHRILRRGRKFNAEGGNDSRHPGKPRLLFVCLNADIERQFEFIQQTWSMAWQFHGLRFAHHRHRAEDVVAVDMADDEQLDPASGLQPGFQTRVVFRPAQVDHRVMGVGRVAPSQDEAIAFRCGVHGQLEHHDPTSRNTV